MKFTMFTVNFFHASAGIRALYLLGEMLIDLGHEVDAVNVQTLPFKDKPPVGCRMNFIESDQVTKSVIITPETIDIKTNMPVLRWVLNHPGLLGGPKCYSENEMVVYYSDEYEASAKAAAIDGVAHELCIGTIEPLTNNGKSRVYDCYYCGKGQSDSSHGLEALKITRHWPETRIELFSLLDRCENFYSYDDNSAITLEAHMLGCNVYTRKNAEWCEYTPDRGQRFIANPKRDRDNVARIVDMLTTALGNG